MNIFRHSEGLLTMRRYVCLRGEGRRLIVSAVNDEGASSCRKKQDIAWGLRRWAALISHHGGSFCLARQLHHVDNACTTTAEPRQRINTQKGMKDTDSLFELSEGRIYPYGDEGTCEDTSGKREKKSAGARDEGIATSKGRTGAVFRPGSSVYWGSGAGWAAHGAM